MLCPAPTLYNMKHNTWTDIKNESTLYVADLR
jgi:hypothetical protein